VIAGAYDVVVAAGVEVMSTTPMGASVTPGSMPFGPKMIERYKDVGGLVPQGISAELIADKWGLSREDLDRFGARSQQLAIQATEEGRFAREIVPVKGKLFDREKGEVVDLDEIVDRDEGLRPGTTAETLAKLKPAFKPDGKVTAANSSQITDGAAAVLIMSEERASQLGLTARARFHTFALAGVDPVTMLTGPIPATTKVLERAGLTMEHHPDMERVNPNGGAIALGHPLGCSGAKLMATLLNELERTGGRYGLQTMCEGGGMANATIIERLG
jgi:acetyl-CoA acyltransferase